MKTARELVADLWPDASRGEPDEADLRIIELVAQRARAEMREAAADSLVRPWMCTYDCVHTECLREKDKASRIRSLPTTPAPTPAGKL